MTKKQRDKLVWRMWDLAAADACARMQTHPPAKELRDLVYILEHLNNMLPDAAAAGQKWEVVFADGESSWNE